jgi:disulfide bond formation protein DsbB
VDWTLFSFSIPEWTLAAFVVFAALGVWLAMRD